MTPLWISYACAVLVQIVGVEILAYTLALLCCMPVLVIAWLFGIKPGWNKSATGIGWAAVAIVVVAIAANNL